VTRRVWLAPNQAQKGPAVARFRERHRAAGHGAPGLTDSSEAELVEELVEAFAAEGTSALDTRFDTWAKLDPMILLSDAAAVHAKWPGGTV